MPCALTPSNSRGGDSTGKEKGELVTIAGSATTPSSWRPAHTVLCTNAEDAKVGTAAATCSLGAVAVGTAAVEEGGGVVELSADGNGPTARTGTNWGGGNTMPVEVLCFVGSVLELCDGDGEGASDDGTAADPEGTPGSVSTPSLPAIITSGGRNSDRAGTGASEAAAVGRGQVIRERAMGSAFLTLRRGEQAGCGVPCVSPPCSETLAIAMSRSNSSSFRTPEETVSSVLSSTAVDDEAGPVSVPMSRSRPSTTGTTSWQGDSSITSWGTVLRSVSSSWSGSSHPA